MSAPHPDEARKGLLYALGCYAVWGLFPLYWYPLKSAAIGAETLLAQRIAWSALFAVLMLLLLPGSHRREFAAVLRHPKRLAVLALSAVLIAANWLVYLWAIVHNHVVEASLGYFVSPLLNVLFGALLLHERLNRIQMAAVMLALVGIGWLALSVGRLPWVAVLLALSFCLYGLVRKTAPVGALTGVAWETLLLLPCALAYLSLTGSGTALFSRLDGLQTAILIGSGLATTVPLLMFAAGARRIPLSTLGILQYGSPTLQMLLGLMLFGEHFDADRFTAFCWVWAGVALYVYGIWRGRQVPIK